MELMQNLPGNAKLQLGSRDYAELELGVPSRVAPQHLQAAGTYKERFATKHTA